MSEANGTVAGVEARALEAGKVVRYAAANELLIDLDSEQVARLERDLCRARRCLASERAGRAALRVRLADEERANAFGVGVLCRLAFPGDESW